MENHPYLYWYSKDMWVSLTGPNGIISYTPMLVHKQHFLIQFSLYTTRLAHLDFDHNDTRYAEVIEQTYLIHSGSPLKPTKRYTDWQMQRMRSFPIPNTNWPKGSFIKQASAKKKKKTLLSL